MLKFNPFSRFNVILVWIYSMNIDYLPGRQSPDLSIPECLNFRLSHCIQAVTNMTKPITKQ